MLTLSLLTILATQPQLASEGLQVPAQSVYSLSDEAFLAQAQNDLAALRRHATGLRRLQTQLAENAALFAKDAKTVASPDEKRTLLTSWAAFYDYLVSLEVIRQRYWDFVTLPPTASHERQRRWGFLLTHGALTTELAHGLTFADLAIGRPQLEVLLDEPSADFGVARKAFAQFKSRIIHVSSMTQLLTGDSYASLHTQVFEKLNEPALKWLLEEIRLNSEVAKGKLLRHGIKMLAKNAADITKDGAFAAIFPVQKSVAEWMGDTRVRRINKPLITRSQVDALVTQLQPGDILVARQNWFLSNIGLPGFWPHAELYVGTPDDLAAYFDGDEQLAAYLKDLPEHPRSLSALLAARYPQKWKEFTSKDAHGDPIRIIEAISEGVSFTTVEHGMRVDYLGAMRPRLSKLDKAKAILRAFHYQGRPYDFDFDFFSDSSLVCTELVAKSYAPAADTRGVSLLLVNVAGRMTLPANELVRKLDEEWDRPDRQLDFVAFLDGRESKRDAVSGDARAFRKSYKRLKWDIAQK